MSDWLWWSFLLGGLFAWISAAVVRSRGAVAVAPGSGGDAACPHCGYDMTGIDQICPECGELSSEAPIPILWRLSRAGVSTALGTIVVLAAIAPWTPFFEGLFVFPFVLITIFVGCSVAGAISTGRPAAASDTLNAGAAFGSTAVVLGVCLFQFAFRRSAIDSSGIAAIPQAGVAGAGYGVLIAAVICTWRRLW